ncbi:hypothetical protein ABOZ73_04750 [Caulobacter sp. 73W]|uniref:Uncharacterized protein n=1 Tax=Caulobacter sp. 73W TaxID=3161137 RepID=A0AB39KWZ3_9CAUL
MAIYTFVVCKPDGTSTSLDVVELSDDHVAAQRAGAVLQNHASSSHVTVWQEDREVCTARREALAS